MTSNGEHFLVYMLEEVILRGYKLFLANELYLIVTLEVAVRKI